ncbi:hypothetical protein [Nocardia sp. NBC_01009]|uniref:hypothetical protein n=1 Tax=Nocardia sp. NBC_01009 TaxID=2975996 RepID=UPI00386666CA|nr:hypothetical protein OHA42_14505 [Nocardia sp. NBC_01009]
MTERSPEDEIISEATTFAAKMQMLWQRHAKASNWAERRRVRREISLLNRHQRREQQILRAHQLTFSTQAVDRYRVHSQVVAQRANDPTVDHERRARDTYALAEHRNRLAAQFIDNEHLSRTEQGIALDGLDAATVFPEFPTGNLFARSHRVKGVDALRYRANVARESAALARQVEQRPTALQKNHRSHVEQPTPGQRMGDRPGQGRYYGQLTWNDLRGGVTTESRSFPSEQVATEWMHRTINDSGWVSGTTVQAQTIDTRAERGGVLFRDDGNPFEVAERLAERQTELLQPELSEHLHHVPGEQPNTHNGRQRGVQWSQAAELSVDQAHSETDRGQQDSGAQARFAEIERQLRDVLADRDRLESRVGVLQRGLDSVTAARDEMKRQLDSANGRIDELRNRNIRLSAEIDELRQRPTIERVAAERDQYKAERDEAVRKLIDRTPDKDRFGNRDRNTNGRNGASAPRANHRFDVVVARADQLELARSQGLKVRELPESQRSVEGKFGTEGEMYDWIHDRVSALDAGTSDVHVYIHDRHNPEPSNDRNIEHPKAALLQVISAKRSKQRDVTDSARNTTGSSQISGSRPLNLANTHNTQPWPAPRNNGIERSR